MTPDKAKEVLKELINARQEICGKSMLLDEALSFAIKAIEENEVLKAQIKTMMVGTAKQALRDKK